MKFLVLPFVLSQSSLISWVSGWYRIEPKIQGFPRLSCWLQDVSLSVFTGTVGC